MQRSRLWRQSWAMVVKGIRSMYIRITSALGGHWQQGCSAIRGFGVVYNFWQDEALHFFAWIQCSRIFGIAH